MRHINTDPEGNDTYQLDNGHFVGTGLKPADMSVMRAAPQYVEAYPLIPRSEWPKPGEKRGGLKDVSGESYSQERTSACGGYGSVNAFTAAWNFEHDELRVFSHDFVYGNVNGGRDQGSRPEDLRDSLIKYGVCLKSTVGPQEIYASRYPKAAYTEAARFRGQPDSLPIIATEDELVTAVLRGHAAFTGIFCGGNFSPNAKGYIGSWDRTQRGGHCTAQIGPVENVDGRFYIWTENSWYQKGVTPMWGINGWCAIPLDYFAAGMQAFGGVAIVSVKSDPLDPTPLPEPATVA